MDMLLYLIYSRLENDRIPFYSDRAEYFEDWLNNKLSNKDLGQKVRNRLVKQTTALARELDDLKLLETRETLEHRTKHQTLRRTLERAGMPKELDDYQAGKWLEEQLGGLKSGYPASIDLIYNNLETSMEMIKQIRGGK